MEVGEKSTQEVTNHVYRTGVLRVGGRTRVPSASSTSPVSGATSDKQWGGTLDGRSTYCSGGTGVHGTRPRTVHEGGTCLRDHNHRES